MRQDLLFDNFNLVADAPDGIPKMREMILQLAVQGKLVPQDPDDEPASELLKRISAEKERLIKEGKIKKQKPLPPIDPDEAPYELPEGWEWARIRDISHDLGQRKPAERFTYIDVNSINNGEGVINTNLKILSHMEAPSRARKIVDIGSVIYSTVRPYLLNVVILDRDLVPKPIVSTAFFVMHPFNGMNSKFIFYYLRSLPFIQYVESAMTGVAYPAINDEKMSLGLIPIPPSNEQKIIAAKVNQLMALCDQMEAEKEKTLKHRVTLNATAIDHLLEAKSANEFDKHWHLIANNFDLLYDNPENVQKLRQAILQLAVSGKLVSQDPSDEPASELLKRIKTEKDRLVKEGKIKKQKPLPPIEPDEVPYELPDGWEWARLIDISEIIMGQSPPGNTYNEHGEGVPLINGPVEFSPGYFGKTIRSKFTSKPTKYCKGNDLLICVRGSTTGRTNIAGFDACIGRGVAAIRSFLDNEYLNWVIVNKRNNIYSIGSGSTFPSISYDKLATIKFPVPPIDEQRRIAKKVDQLMALCDQMEAYLENSSSQADTLFNTIAEQVTASSTNSAYVN